MRCHEAPRKRYASAQVCRRIRRIVHTRVATRLHIRQPRLTPCRLLALANLSCGSFTAATSLDLSCCLDWVQHPSLTTLVDLRAITVMTQLRELKLRPSYDAIDSFEGDRVKLKSGVLCWADGIMMRLWDRWMYALSPGIPTILHKTALAALSQLETLHFPITVRVTEDPHQRTQSVLSLPHLRSLALGGAALVDADVATLASASTLTYLSIGECAGLTDVGLRTLGGMSHLCVLLLHGCARMGVHDRWAALRRLSVLHTLALYGRREGENVHFRHLVDPAPQCVPIGCEGALQYVCPASMAMGAVGTRFVSPSLKAASSSMCVCQSRYICCASAYQPHTQIAHMQGLLQSAA